MSKTEDNNHDEIIAALLLAGFTTAEAKEIIPTLSEEQKTILLESDTNTTKKPPKTKGAESSGFLSALITAGFTPLLASAVISALSDDEKVVNLLRQNKRPLTFMTQQDSKVDDIICLPQQGDVWEQDDSKRPRIPEDTHENCRCFWQDPITGKNLGQF